MLLSVENVGIETICAAVSKNLVPFEERLKNLVDAKKISRLKKTTGFESFSVADEKICTSDFCALAAEKIFSETEINRADIRAVIFVSQTADYFLPSTAHILQARLNLPKDTAAFDISLGCSGFVYGLYIAASMIQNLPEGKILLLCGDTATRNIFKEDISCLSVFGDAGAAAIISKCNAQKIFFNLQSFGELSNAIIMQRGAYRNSLLVENNSLDVAENFVTMDGVEVMKFSAQFVPPNLKDLLNFAAVKISDVDKIFLHQANKLIVENIMLQLKLTPEKVPFGAGKFGNTSSASIPLLISEMQGGGLSLLSGFGVGMSIASALIDLRNLICLPLEKL